MSLLKNVNGKNPRQIAARVLQQRRAAAGFTEDLLENALAGARLSPADRALCQEIAYGVVRWQATLDWLIARKTGGRNQKPALQNLLRLGLYQSFWLDRIPGHAAVNETVELARQNGFGAQAGFVNAVLRGYLREADATKKLLADLKISQPALGWSHPAWLVARWQKRWGLERTSQLLAWNNTPPKTFVRVNALKFGGAGSPLPAERGNAGNGAHGVTCPALTSASDLLARWREENVEYDFVRRDWLEEDLVFELKSHPPLAKLESFQQGWFYIQDPSTLFAPCVLDPQAGETILDLCAAPGGKTTFIAQLMNNQGRIVAMDNSAERLKLLEENCARLGVACVETLLSAPRPGPLPVWRGEGEKSGAMQKLSLAPPKRGEGGQRPGEGIEKFDRILIDAPCSNTGVMRRRVDLRWRVQPKEISRLQETQLGLLKEAAPALKPGGVLVYSTCSLEPEENQEVVKEFLRRCPGFKLESEHELLPFADHMDGAYVARLK